jgi:hypothetical protein
MAWGLAVVLAAAGCGSRVGFAQTSGSSDPHQGPDVSCGVCQVTGSGQLHLGARVFQVDVQAVQDGSGAGWSGEGSAAKGHLTLHEVGGQGEDLDGLVDTITSCTREQKGLHAWIAGATAAGARFQVELSDMGGAHTEDSLSCTSTLSFVPTEVASGEVVIQGLERCDAPCNAGQCLCPDDHVTCETCHPPPPPPQCLEGMCWCADSNACEVCLSPPPPPAPPPPPPPPPPPAPLPG